jgi:hypothetical protein
MEDENTDAERGGRVGEKEGEEKYHLTRRAYCQQPPPSFLLLPPTFTKVMSE